MKITDLRRLATEAAAEKQSDQKAHNEYYVFLQKKLKLGRPLTKAEQDFIKTHNLKQLTKQNFEDKDVAEGADEHLDEVKMSPSVFAKWAASPEAQGIRAGFEAEMIFRNTKRDDDDGDMEPDYDYDERARGIEDIVDFFSNDEYGYGLSSRGARDLREELSTEYLEWRTERISEQWSDDKDQQIEDYMETNVWGDDSEREDRIIDQIDNLFPDDDVQAILQAGEAAPRFTKTSDQQEYINQNELYKKYKEAEDAAYEQFQAEVKSEQENTGGDYYEAAYEYYTEMMIDGDDFDEDEWLDDIGYRYMSDVANDRSLDWPIMMGGRSGGDREWDDIASDLRSVLGGDYEVRVGSGYHSAPRKDNRWIIEPDGSLEPDDSDDSGLEIVSPPMALPEALEKLEQIIEWGNSDADAYTNESTGLHMGVSLPFKGGDVDYVKLVLFMGDQYVLEKFERQGNTYCASALEKLKQTQRARQQGDRSPEKTATALELIQKNLIELAQRYVQDGVGNSKYTSAHIKDGYIEFRSPGGDYLSMANRNEFDEIKNTMLRFAYSMYLAGRPDLERKEYAKKMYKLLGAEGNDALKLFADYTTGNISKEELKVLWAKQVLSKEAPDAELEVYEVFNVNTQQVLDVIKAKDYSDALTQFRTRYRDNDNWMDLDIRKYRGDTDELVNKNKLSRRGQVAKRISSQPKVFRVSVGDRSIDVIARDEQDAKIRAGQQDEYFDRNRSYLSVKILTTKAVSSDNEKDSFALKARIGQPQPAGGGEWTGSWLIKDTQGRVLHRFHGIGNNQADANRIALRWLTDNGYGSGTEVEVVPEMHTSTQESVNNKLSEDLDYILYVNNKPAARYQSEFDANNDFKLLTKKFPDKKFEIKKEVCQITTIRRVGEGKSLLDNPIPTAQEIIKKHGMSEEELIQQIKLGIKTELEHTGDAKKAMEIALVNIDKFPDYYDRLKKVEK